MASPTRLSERRILLVAIVFNAKARFKLNRRPRRALLIGITYEGSKKWKLLGPQKDVDSMRTALIEKYGFHHSDIILLSDRQENVAYKPTRENMIRELKGFVSPKNKNTDYVFVYAGHCVQFEVPRTREEPDGLAESLVPVDAVTLGEDNMKDAVIFDFDLKKWLVDSLKSSSRLVAIIDACSSATVLNLEHHRCNRTGSITAKARKLCRMCIFRPFGIPMFSKLYQPKPSSHDTSGAGKRDREGSLDTCNGLCRLVKGEQSPAVCISACKDSENVFENKEGQSLIQSILHLWDANPNPTYNELGKAVWNDGRAMRHELRKDFRNFLMYPGSPLGTGILQNNPLSRWIESHDHIRSWHMQISTSYPLDLNKRFALCGSAAR